MRTFVRAGLGLFTLLVSACSGGEATPTPSGSVKASAAPSARASASAKASAAPSSSAATDDDKRGKMSNCPSAVANAKTEIADTDKGITVAVTAAEPEGISAIQARAKDVEAHAKDDAAQKPHSGQGGGAGQMGRCPVVVNDTSVTVAITDKGATFTIEPKNAKEVEWLRREAKERLAQMPGASAKGDRKMLNCPSAVEGAATKVAEAKDAIVVTVVAKDEAKTKEIRERATKLGAAKHDGKSKHDGAGTGPGEGRCPAVLEGTTSSTKEVAGGVEITLTPTDKANLKKLVGEAQDRAKPFQ